MDVGLRRDFESGEVVLPGGRSGSVAPRSHRRSAPLAVSPQDGIRLTDGPRPPVVPDAKRTSAPKPHSRSVPLCTVSQRPWPSTVRPAARSR